MDHLWGIDLGGTKIEGVILPRNSIDPVCRLRVPTEQEGGYQHILCQIGKLVKALEVESGLQRPKKIGIGTPGNIGPNGLIKNSNTVCLIGKPLKKDLEELLNAELVCMNDANCFALAEARLGSAKGNDVVFGVILGTGVGGGVVVNGHVLNGLQGIAGEWGHNVLDPDGPLCYCGKRGCVETLLSGPGLERTYFAKTETKVRVPEIVVRARSGEPEAKQCIDEFLERFGRALSVVINILDPDAVVLGGGVGNIDELYSVGREHVAKNVLNDGLDTKLLRPTLGDSAGVFGAAMLVE